MVVGRCRDYVITCPTKCAMCSGLHFQLHLLDITILLIRYIKNCSLVTFHNYKSFLNPPPSFALFYNSSIKELYPRGVWVHYDPMNHGTICGYIYFKQCNAFIELTIPPTTVLCLRVICQY